jgi:hypothetical protein
MKRMSVVLMGAAAMLMTGCASQQAQQAQQALRYTSKYMTVVESKTEASYAPSTNESLVIFMRPNVLGYAVQACVYDVTTGENQLVGIVSARTKLAYKTTPGEHLFMAVSETADFLKASLAPGKTYYVRVVPRMGAWRARFSLAPVRRDERTGPRFKEQDDFCRMVENSDGSRQWAKDNAQSVQTKRAATYSRWMSKPAAARPELRAEDGL